jgi:hypothetical protein
VEDETPSPRGTREGGGQSARPQASRSDGDEIGDEIQRILSTYSQNR